MDDVLLLILEMKNECVKCGTETKLAEMKAGREPSMGFDHGSTHLLPTAKYSPSPDLVNMDCVQVRLELMDEEGR